MNQIGYCIGTTRIISQSYAQNIRFPTFRGSRTSFITKRLKIRRYKRQQKVDYEIS